MAGAAVRVFSPMTISLYTAPCAVICTRVHQEELDMSTPAPSPMQLTVATGKTDYWNDSCSVPQLTYGISHGAVGATTNPSIVLTVLRNELPTYAPRLTRIIGDHPSWSETE